MDDHYLKNQNDNEGYSVPSNKRIRILNYLLIPAIVLLFSIVISYFMLSKSISSLEGIWVRQHDDNPMANGMVIEVKKENGIYVGEVISIDDESGMDIGTLKWTGFQKDALNVFAYYDMSLSVNAMERQYSVGYALISLDGKELTVFDPSASIGKHQIWLKKGKK